MTNSITRLVSVVLSLGLASACGSDGSTDSVSNGGKAGSGSGGGTGGSTSGGSGGTSAGGSNAGGAGGGGTNAGGMSGGGGASGSGGSTCKATLPAPTYVDPKTAKEVSIKNDPGAAAGIFDPSIEYPLGAPAGAMSYSGVIAQNDISTRIAVSTDQGATWTFVAAANQSKPATVPVPVGSPRCPSGTCSGQLIHEVSSLVFDADDPDTTRRWKLFAHSYLVMGQDKLQYDLGYISLFTAAEPHLTWTDEGKVVGWNSESEFSSKGAKTLATSFPALADCVVLTEPDVMWRQGGVLELAVGCVKLGSPSSIRIELLRSFDHAKTFLYASRLLEASDAHCLGGSLPQVNAPELFVAQGKTWLIATPAGPVPPAGTGYRGCFVMPVAAGGKGVQRDTSGAPKVERVLDAPDGRFTGACSVAEGAAAMGYAVSEASFDTAPNVFHIFQSGQAAP
ncbi:MAG: hypothetical protein IPI67_21165 [Myxococcales bacterium]|nr:hypothetical protein [Myxococcales bacterium]